MYKDVYIRLRDWIATSASPGGEGCTAHYVAGVARAFKKGSDQDVGVVIL